MKSSVLSWSALSPWSWTPHGADGTDDDDTGDGGQQDDGGTQDDAGDDDDGAGTQTVTQAQYDELQRKFDQMKSQLSANDKSKAALQKQIDDAKRKEQTDLKNAQDDVARLTQEGVTWKDRYERLALTNAFLIESARAQITWHDPVVAQAAAALAELEVGDDGTVSGMADAVKKLAKDKAFLVNATPGSAGTAATNGSKTGTKVGAGKTGKGQSGQLTDEELKIRFPALRE